MPERLIVETLLGHPREGAPARHRDPQAPMRLLLTGDFSGCPSASRPPLAERPTLRVDLDNLDTVVRRLAPALTLPEFGSVSFETIDDFHPDRLLERLSVFRPLLDMRQRLLDPALFPQAAAELRQAALVPVPQASDAEAPAGDDLLARLLGGRPAAAGRAAAPAAGIDAFVSQVVAPHIVHGATVHQATCVASVDAALAGLLRALLHAPAFQALESAWRGVHWLVGRLELDESLQLHLFDVTRDELLADIVAAEGHIERTGTYRVLVDRWRNQPGGEGWSALVGLLRFGASDTDIGLLAALGIVASQAGGPWLADGDPTLAGGEESALDGWRTLRGSEVAPWIGLMAPRLLLRMPYGALSDPIMSFPFEELENAPVPVHAHYLWGSAALGGTVLLGQAFTARGWEFEPGDEREIGDLPSCTRISADGLQELVPCAERWLGDQEAQAWLASGLMPMLSDRRRNAATVMRFQSIAEPSSPLRGPWTRA